MKYLKIFEEYENAVDRYWLNDKQNDDYNKSMKDYSIWVPEMYKHWSDFQTTVDRRMGKLPQGLDQIQGAYPTLGYGKDLKRLLSFMTKYKVPSGLVKHLDEGQRRVGEIRSKFEGRWDDILVNRKGTKEDYAMLSELRNLNNELSDLHWIWETCFKNHSFDTFHEVNDIIVDFADDYNLEVYLSSVELFRGLQLGFLLFDEGAEVKMSTDWNIRTREYTYDGVDPVGGNPISKEAKDSLRILSDRLDNYFGYVSVKPLDQRISVELSNQKD